MPLLSALFILIYSFSSMSFADSYSTSTAIKYYKNGDYKRAKSVLLDADLSNDPVGTYMMGAITLVDDEFGQTNANIDRAIYWFEISASLNYPQAFHALGRTYEQKWINQSSLDDYEKSKINYELAINNSIDVAHSDLSRLVSSSSSNLDEADKQRLDAINSRTYLTEQKTPLVEPYSELVEPTTDTIAVIVPSDTVSKRKVPSNIWKMRPFIGFTSNGFSVLGTDFSGTDTNTNNTVSVAGDSKDSGSAGGLTAGVFISEDKKVGLSYFSGEDKDSSVFTVTVASIYIDHSFNNYGVHQGWFLGGGASSVEIEIDETSFTVATTADAAGLMLRGGYEYMFDIPMYLEAGVNFHLVDVDQTLIGKGENSNIKIDSTMNVRNFYLSLSYLF